MAHVEQKCLLGDFLLGEEPLLDLDVERVLQLVLLADEDLKGAGRQVEAAGGRLGGRVVEQEGGRLTRVSKEGHWVLPERLVQASRAVGMGRSQLSEVIVMTLSFLEWLM